MAVISYNLRKQLFISRARINFAIYCICTVVCFQQLVKFMMEYFSYPTTVDVEVVLKHPKILPGITLCFNEALLAATFCNMSREYCQINGILRSDDALSFMSRPENRVKVLEKCMFRHQNYVLTNDSYISADKCRSNYVSTGFEPCVVVNVIWGRPLVNDRGFAEFMIASDSVFLTRADVNDNRFGINLFLHSPYIVPERNVRSYFISFGSIYKINFSKIVVYTLAPPYQTQCLDYRNKYKTEKYFENVSSETCYYHCLWNKLQDKCGCIPSPVAFIEGYIACNLTEKRNCLERVDVSEKRNMCKDQCPTACRVEHYDYSVDQLVKYKDMKTRLEIFEELRSHTIVIFNHKPLITELDFFSSVGGYLGIWLGLSIPKFSDIISDTFLFFITRLKLNFPGYKARLVRSKQ